MPEYSSTTITPSDGVQVPGMNGSTSGNFLLSALKSYILSEKGLANGLASLDGNGKLLSSQLPDLADDVIVVASYASLPATGTAGKIYITADNNKMYRWDPDLETPNYVELSIDLSEYAKIVDIQDGNIQAGVAVKAFQDAMGRAIITTYETKADASDLKDAINKNTAEIENLKQTSAQTEISVDYPKDATHTELFPNLVPAKSAKYAEIKCIVGKSRAWNSFVPDKTSQTINGITFTVDNDNHTITMSGTATANASFSFYFDTLSSGFKGVVGHKYLLYGQSFPEGYFALLNNGGMNDTWYSNSEPNGFIVTCIDATIGSGFVLRVLNGNTINRTVPYPVLRDLAVIFPDLPSTDLVKDNIPNLVKRCPDLLKPDAYGYSFVDTVVVGVKSVGKNLCDTSAFENVNISTSGNVDPNLVCGSSTDYIAVVGGSQMTFSTKTAINGVRIAEYDADKNFLNRSDTTQITAITLRANTKFVRWCINYNGSTTVTKAILDSVEPQLEYGSSRTTFSEYREPSTLSLPTPVTLRSAGSVAEVYDLESGEKTNPISQTINLGELNWSYGSTVTSGIYSKKSATALTNPKIVASNVVSELTCSLYVKGSANQAYVKNSVACIDSDGKLVIFDPNYTASDDMSSFKQMLLDKQATLIYELATPDVPTQLTPVIDNTLKVEPNGTIETVQDNTYPDDSPAPTIDNSMTVNFDLIP